jgi:DNA-binding FadR family transcriptional regulator
MSDICSILHPSGRLWDHERVPLQSLRRDSLGAQALSRLRELVQGGEWPVGTKIPSELQLASQLEVGRSTVREAVQAMVHAGLLESRRGDGTYVRATNELQQVLTRHLGSTQMLEIYEVRRALEVEAARLASARRDADDLAAMRGALQARVDAAGDVQAFLDADIAFHVAIVQAARNPILRVLYDGMVGALREALVPVVAQGLQAHDTNAMHAALLAAIEAQDAEAAVRATEEHLAGTEDAIIRSHP